MMEQKRNTQNKKSQEKGRGREKTDRPETDEKKPSATNEKSGQNGYAGRDSRDRLYDF